MSLGVLDHDPYRWSKTPGKPPETSGIWLDVGRHKSPANGPVLRCISVRLKIEVSAVRVRLSPLKSPANSHYVVTVQCPAAQGSSHRIVAGVGGEQLAEVGEQRVLLKAAGDRRREQALDTPFATLGLAAERELAVDHCAAQGALGVVVGRLYPFVAGEGP
jgi:hypothetical protein